MIICVGRLSKLRLDVDLTRHFIPGGGRVGERRRAVNPFLLGEWVRIPPSRPRGLSSGTVMSSSKNETLRVLSSLPKGIKMNTIRCEYRRGPGCDAKSS